MAEGDLKGYSETAISGYVTVPYDLIISRIIAYAVGGIIVIGGAINGYGA